MEMNHYNSPSTHDTYADKLKKSTRMAYQQKKGMTKSTVNRLKQSSLKMKKITKPSKPTQ